MEVICAIFVQTETPKHIKKYILQNEFIFIFFSF